MILSVKGELSRYYAESLALLFFPGSKFPVDTALDTDNITINIEVYLHDLTASASVTICGSDKESHGDYTVPDEVAARKTPEMRMKIAAGGAMLISGERYTGACPPWGMLTGVRPAKMAAGILSTGKTEAEAVEQLCEDFLCEKQKARLAVMCAKTENVYITEKSRSECSIYIAIPFCPSKCSYCSFVSFTSERLLSLIPSYLMALCEDIKHVFSIASELELRVSTVYIGGGTPTVLSSEQLEALLSVISLSIDTATLDEFTLEAGRPDTITEEKLRVAKEYGVTRISVNTQTLSDKVLKNIGRSHTSDDFFAAYEMAVKSGIRDINVDLIAGLPGDTLQSFQYSVDKITELEPTNITVHTFYAKRAAEMVKNNKEIYRLSDEETKKEVNYSQNKVLSYGYLPYYMYRQKNTAANLENVGYSKPGHEGIYNIMMMEEIHTVFGAGASAMTKLVSTRPDNMKIVRICEPKYPYEYLDGHENKNKKNELFKAAKSFYDNF